MTPASGRERRADVALAAAGYDGAVGHDGGATVELRALLDAAAVEAVAERAAALVLERLGPVNESPLLTVPEAAAWLRCGRQRVDDLLSQGRLIRHKDGARTLVSRAELAAYVGLNGDAPAMPPAAGTA
jgi:excisionase family DNA binding protein